MGKLTLLLGGARSGKSSLAEKIALNSGKSVGYIATARGLDEEMRTRIQRHRAGRPESWHTLELPLNVATGWVESGLNPDLVILDCLTLLVTNIILDSSPDVDNPDEIKASAAVDREIKSLIDLTQADKSAWIIVSNEVGLGLVPPYPLGRVYRDLLGRANQKLASVADEVFFLVAGVPVPIHQFRIS
jgi:adenosylcobinamide kinase/adenosylcobinamide-phosphate guanylyltransferase